MSWEITLNKNKSFHFISENLNDNVKWFNTLDAIFYKNNLNFCNHDLNVSNIDEDDTISHVSSTNRGLFNKNFRQFSSNSKFLKLDLSNDIYDVVIDRDLTDPKFFTKLTLNTVYLITIDEAGISLQDKNSGEMHAFESQYENLFFLCL